MLRFFCSYIILQKHGGEGAEEQEEGVEEGEEDGKEEDGEDKDGEDKDREDKDGEDAGDTILGGDVQVRFLFLITEKN